jgi:hypothetical protein
MNMYNAFYEGAVIMPDNETQTPDSRIKQIFSHINVGFIVAAVIVLVVAGFAFHKITQKHQGFPVTIGGTTITAQDVINYAAEITAYQKLNPQSNFGASPTQVAVNDLVLNAAFKDEAKKLNQPLTNADIENASYAPLNTAAQKQQYITQLDSGATAIRIRAENIAYEQKFSNALIAKKNLTIVGIDFDTPYFAQAPQAKVQSLYDQAQARIQNTIMPLMKRGASDNEIGNKVDLSFKNGLLTKGNDNYQQYFQKAVLDMDVETGYTTGTNLFNDISSTSYVRGNVGKLYSTNAKINSLTKVGQYTDMFSSKAGIFMVIRLDSENGGKYNSWNDFLAQYKQQYGLTSSNISKEVGAKIVSSINNVVSILSSVGEGQASASVPGGCGSHNVEFTGRSWDTKYNVPIGGTGTTFHEYRSPAGFDCPGTVSGTATAVTGGSNNTIYDNCFSPQPDWGIDSLPSGYTPVTPGGGGQPYPPNPNTPGVSENNKAGGQYVAMRSGPDSNFNNGDDYDGWPIWTPGSINNTGHVYIVFLYQGQCNSCSCNSSDCNSNPPEISCTNFQTDSPASGDYETYWVTDSSGNTEVGTSNTGVNKQASGSFAPEGQVLYLHAYSVNSRGGTGATHTWSTTGNCFSATCTMYIDGNLPDGGVQAGSNFTINYTITNTSQPGVGLPNTLPGFNLDLTQPGPAPRDVNYGPGIAPNSTQSFSYTATAPDSSGTYSTNGYPDYYGDFALGGQCNGGAGVSVPVEIQAASCSIDSVVGTLPGGYVEGGQPFTVTATVTNTGTAELALSENGDPLSLNHGDSNGNNSYWAFPDQNLGVTLFPGQSVNETFTQTANLPNPPDPAQETIYAHVAYSNYFALSNNGPPAQCAANIDMYVPFGLSGAAKTTPLDSLGRQTTDEDPSSFNYQTTVTSTAPVPVDIPPYDGTSVSTVYETPVGTVIKNYYNPPGTVDNNGTYNPGTNTVISGNKVIPLPLVAGNSYNAQITLPFTAAYVGGNGPEDVILPATPDSYVGGFPIENDPFFKVQNGGIEVGGNYPSSGNCTGGGTLGSWNNDSGLYPDFGAGSQLHALALGNLVGFSSDTNSPEKLNFSNTTNIAATGSGGSAYSQYMGGQFGGSHCITTLAPGSGPGTTSLSGNQTIGPMTLNAGPNANQTIYVTGGNVYIAGNITYNTAGWSINSGPSFSTNIPSLTLIVNGGNIYIDPGVTKLDGLYTAQTNSGGTGGTIYTCGIGTTAPYTQRYSISMNGNNLYQYCNNQLTVNGTFIAKKVDLQRTYGSLRDEQSPGPTSCSNAPAPPVGGTCAAEVFNLSPELYISSPDLALPSGGAQGYDAETSLPPVL